MKDELRIPMDPNNPAQFYACGGLLELFELLGKPVISQFELDRRRPRSAVFVISGANRQDLENLLYQVASADYEPLTDCPAEESVKPVRATLAAGTVDLDWWLDEFHQEPTTLKCWAGQVKSGQLFAELPPLIRATVEPSELFFSAQASKKKFGIDPRSAWNALDFGYSPNEQGQDAATFPAVETFAAFGLQSFRPFPTRNRQAEYSLWRQPLPRLAALQASLDPWDGADVWTFRFEIAKRGQSYKYFTPATLVWKGNP